MNIHELEYTSDSQQSMCFDLGIHVQNVNKGDKFGYTVKRGLLIAADPCQQRLRDPLVLAVLAESLSGQISILFWSDLPLAVGRGVRNVTTQVKGSPGSGDVILLDSHRGCTWTADSAWLRLSPHPVSGSVDVQAALAGCQGGLASTAPGSDWNKSPWGRLPSN